MIYKIGPEEYKDLKFEHLWIKLGDNRTKKARMFSWMWYKGQVYFNNSQYTKVCGIKKDFFEDLELQEAEKICVVLEINGQSEFFIRCSDFVYNNYKSLPKDLKSAMYKEKVEDWMHVKMLQKGPTGPVKTKEQYEEDYRKWGEEFKNEEVKETGTKRSGTKNSMENDTQ